LEVLEARSRGELREFIEFPYTIYAEDSLYAPPLRREMREHFSGKNPFFIHGEVRFFIARKKKKPVGRIVSIVDRRHIDFHREKAGFFGFFEAVNDQGVAKTLLDAVTAALRERGMETMRGPMNFSTNEECGFLSEGFNEPPMLMTPYNPFYYHDLMETCGMRKAKDLYAYIYEVREELPDKVLRVAAIAERRGIRIRAVDMKRFTDDMAVFREIYNSAWEKNWGFIPLSGEEVDYISVRLKQIAVPELTLIAEDRGTPVGFMGLLPDFNQVLRHMKGKLTPLSLAKALYYSRKIRSLRLLLLGIRPEYRNKGIDALLFKEGFKGIRKGGYRMVEFSWILEDNIPVQRLAEMIGGRLYKKYRIYEKGL
jgi:GNAT superfamily N-acetyltransferase